MALFGRRSGTRATRLMKVHLGLAAGTVALTVGGVVAGAQIEKEKTSAELAYGAVTSDDPTQGEFRGLGALAPDVDQLRPTGTFLGMRSPFADPKKSPLETFSEKTDVDYVPNSNDFRPGTSGQVLHDVFEYDRTSRGFQKRRDDIYDSALATRAKLAALDNDEEWASIAAVTGGFGIAISVVGLAYAASLRRHIVRPWGGPGMLRALPVGLGMQGAGGEGDRRFATPGPDDVTRPTGEDAPAHSDAGDPDAARFTQADLDAARKQGARDGIAGLAEEFARQGGVVLRPGPKLTPLSTYDQQQGRHGGPKR